MTSPSPEMDHSPSPVPEQELDGLLVELGVGAGLEALLERVRQAKGLHTVVFVAAPDMSGPSGIVNRVLGQGPAGHAVRLATLEQHGSVLGEVWGTPDTERTLEPLGPQVCALLLLGLERDRQREQLEHSEAQASRVSQQLEALHALSLEVSSQHQPEQVIARSLELCCSVLGAQMAGYWRVVPDPQGGAGHWQLEQATGSATLVPGARVRRDVPVVQNRVLEGSSVRIEDYQAYRHANPEVVRMGWRSLLLAPIGRGEDMRGVFTLADNRRTNAFSTADQALLERFAALTEVALGNAQLLESTRAAEQLALRQLAQLEALHLLEVEVASQRDPRRVVEKALELSCELFGVEAGGYWRIFRNPGQASHLELRLKHGGVLEPIGTQLPLGEGAVSEVVERGTPLLIPDYRRYPRRSERIRTPYRSMLLVPLRFGEELLGVLSVADLEPEIFTLEDLELFGRFARLVAVALAGTRLLEQAQEAEARLRRRADLLETLSEMSRELSQELEPERLFRSVLERATRLFGVAQGGLYLPDANRQTLHLVSNLGKPQLPSLQWGEGLVGQVAMSARARVLDDYSRWEGQLRRGRAHILRSVMAVPLGSGEQVSGVLILADLERPGVFSEEDLEMLSRLASLATVALENAQLYQIARRNARFERLRAHIAATVASSHSPREFCERLLGELSLAFGYAHLFIGVLEPGGLCCQASLGYSPSLSGQMLSGGVTGRVVGSGQSAWIRDARQDPDWVVLDPTLDQVLCVALRGRGQVRGVIGIESNSQQPLTHSAFEHLEAIAESVGVALENLLLMEVLERRTRELEKLSREAEHAATHDSLTKLPNRRAFERDARGCIRQAELEQIPFTLLAIDLSGFKAVNDRIGHTAGDHALQRIAHVLASVCPKAYRTGGDEFLLLLEMKMGRAGEVADYIVQRLEALEFDRGLRIRPNIGLAEYPREATALDPLQTLADARMYAAKRLGVARLTPEELEQPPVPRRRAEDQPQSELQVSGREEG